MYNEYKPYAAFLLASATSLLNINGEDTIARNDSAASTVYQLDEYVLVANTYAVPAHEIGSTVNVITREDLELSRSPFVLDAIRELPGISLRNNGGPGGVFSMTTRGLNSNRPTILIDGIEMSNPATGTIFNLGTLFSNSVERVEFLKGAQSALYGADALAGVINIQTRDTVEDGYRGSLSAGYGTDNTREADASFQLKEGVFDFALGLNYYNTDGFSALKGNNEDDNYENTNLNAKLGYQATDTLKLYALFYSVETEAEYDDSPTLTDALFTERHLFAKAGATLDICETWETQLNFGFTETNSISDGTYGVFFNEGDRYKADWRNIVAVNSRWDLVTGLEFELEDNRDAAGKRDTSSIYADNVFEVVQGLHWTLGGRYDDNSDYGISRTWRTSLNYQIKPLNSRLHASYGTSFQAPTFFQTTDAFYGNPNLLPEEGKSWDIGIETKLFDERLVLDVTAFRNEIENQINFITLTSFPDPFTGTYINNSEYKSQGIETTLTFLASEDLQFRANYTFTDNAEYSDGSDAERVPKHLANLSANYKLLEDALRLKISLNYVGKQYDNAFATEQQPDYATVDLAGQYDLSETFTLWSSINNLFDKDYEEIVGYNTAGFNLRAGVRIHF